MDNFSAISGEIGSMAVEFLGPSIVDSTDLRPWNAVINSHIVIVCRPVEILYLGKW